MNAYHVPSTSEQLRVLITVRVHLDRSATRSRFEEERQHDRLPLEVAQADGGPEHAVTRGAGENEVRRDGTHGERLRIGRRGGGGVAATCPCAAAAARPTASVPVTTDDARRMQFTPGKNGRPIAKLRPAATRR